MQLTRTIALLSLCLAAGAFGARAAELVVVESTAADLAVGTVVDDADPIQLAAGASLTLMSSTGEMLLLSGPFAGPPRPAQAAEAPEAGLVAAVSDLLRPQEPTAVSGAFRSGSPAGEPPPEIWLIDPDTGGLHCLPASAPASLWRADTSREAVLEIWGDEGDKVVWWEEGEAIAGWPDDLPLTDGAVYELNWEESLESVETSIARVPAETRPNGAGLRTLIDRGCRRQALGLLARLLATAGSDDPANAATAPDPGR